MYFAHSTDDRSQANWQRLDEHLNAVAGLASGFAAGFGAADAARLAGLLHDLGKYSLAFQARLSGAPGSVDHSTAGAAEVLALVESGRDAIAAELIAYAIAGHHAGLPDKIGGDGSLTERLKKVRESLDPVWRREINPDSSALMPAHRFDHANKAKAAFQLGFLGRMIFSCLVDADFRDTEAFYSKAEGWHADRDWPRLGEILDQLTAAFDAYMADKQAKAAATSLNRLRREILEHVRERASEPPGLFTLTVPTGGGKTLASLAFALDHAKKHGLERIVYAIPFTSIIDQTAAVFRDVLGAAFILEHHSAIDEEKNGRREGPDKLKLAMEDWAAPIVVTTNVQLFESLFANRPSRCRKLHNLARSVIVLDEAQTIPLALLRPSVAALDELARNYGATIVLCTATQPALDARNFGAGDPIGLALEGRELAPDPDRLSRELKRVQINKGGAIGDDALVRALAAEPQGLVIVNSRAHALALFRKAKEAGLDGVVHLSTRQYAAHRRIILQDVKRRLEDKRPCRLIATSLVEAGVDLDFPRVWRAQSGLDQVAQAAGRCNREGRHAAEDSIVTVFDAPDNPPPREIKLLAEDFARMAGDHDDLLSPAAMQDYFGEVYWRKDASLDAKGILDMFGVSAGKTSFAYRTVAEEFRMIESGMAPVIVARDDAASDSVAQLWRPDVRPGAIARALQSYVVQVPPKARALLLANKHLEFVNQRQFGDQFGVLRTPSLYREDEGLLWEDAEYLGLEDSIM